MHFLKRLSGGGPDTPLDNTLVARIVESLKIEPSEQLREILAQGADRGGDWSPEAVEAARLLLEQRSNNLAPEPVDRPAPRTQPEAATGARPEMQGLEE